MTLTYVIAYDGDPTSIVLGAPIRAVGGGTWINDPSHDTTVSLRPGRNTYSRTFTVPLGIAPGSYDIVWGLLGTDMQTSYGLQVEASGLHVADAGRPVARPVDVVRQFYELIDARNYAAAWALLSTRYQATTTYANWEAGYRNTRSVMLAAANPVDSMTVAISVFATDNEAGRLVPKKFEGTWAVIFIDGAWKLDLGKIRQVS
jgi:hypothetical protein